MDIANNFISMLLLTLPVAAIPSPAIGLACGEGATCSDACALGYPDQKNGFCVQMARAESQQADLEAFTKFCKDSRLKPPVFENGCYSVPQVITKCDEQGKLTYLDLKRRLFVPLPQSIGNLVNLKYLYFDPT